eukprot:357886-Chlamydomonas_euryale.AAC.6
MRHGMHAARVLRSMTHANGNTLAAMLVCSMLSHRCPPRHCPVRRMQAGGGKGQGLPGPLAPEGG